VELASLVLAHEKTDKTEVTVIRELIKEFSGNLSPAELSAAEARGRTLKLEDVVAEILQATAV
jgi:hypothetical protein